MSPRRALLISAWPTRRSMPRDGATIFGDLIGKFDVLPIEIANARRMGRYVRAPHTGIKDGHSSARLPPLALPGSARPPLGVPRYGLIGPP